MASKVERKSSDVLTSPIYEHETTGRLVSDLRAVEFYHPNVGFGTLREYALDLDETCTIAKLHDEKVPELRIRNDYARCEFSDEAGAIKIIDPAVYMFCALRHAVKIAARPDKLISSRLSMTIGENGEILIPPDIGPRVVEEDPYGLGGKL
jgi:hypothetical protein